MKWLSRAAGFAAVAAFVLAVVLSTSCARTLELVLLAIVSGLLCGVWLDEPARRRRRRVLEFLAAFYVVTLAVLGVTLPLNATACG
jgi:predicted PurR-regulated permease PerM